MLLLSKEARENNYQAVCKNEDASKADHPYKFSGLSKHE
jgi:hypothetical protein